MTEPNGSGVGLTLRELVLEVREDVKEIREIMPDPKVVEDSKNRIRSLEIKVYGFIALAIVLGGVFGRVLENLGVA